jgi:hypothetical protein
MYPDEHEFEQLAQALLVEEEIRIVYPDSGRCQTKGREVVTGQAASGAKPTQNCSES